MTFIAEEHNEKIEHLDGVPWFSAPVPPREHECWAQTRGYLYQSLVIVERCACGGIHNTNYDGWLEKNSRAVPEEVEAQMDALEDRLVWLQRTQSLCLGVLIAIGFILLFWALAEVF